MKHYDEHTLEMFVLGEIKAPRQARQITNHLAKCPGCRQLADQMQQFYSDLRKTRESATSQVTVVETAIARAKGRVPDLFRKDYGPLSSVPTSFVARSWALVWRNPVVVAAGGGILVLAAAILALVQIRTTRLADENPAKIHPNRDRGYYEILNKSEQLLWEVPADPLTISQVFGEPFSATVSRYKVADLDNDGRNEVILPVFSTDSTSSSIDCTLRIYSYQGRLLHEMALKEPTQFRGQSYNEMSRVFSIGVVSTGIGKPKEIVAAAEAGRSPCVLVRFSNSGVRLGEYWHYGLLLGPLVLDFDGNGSDELVFAGRNDAVGEEGESYPVLAVLDPARIMGKSECTVSPGFGYAPSQAELYYLRFPVPEVARVLSSRLSCNSVTVERKEGKPILHVWIAGNYQDAQPRFEYLLSPRAEVLEVRKEDGTESLVARLRPENPHLPLLNPAYLKSLGDQVRYWNGQAWQSLSVRVKHPESHS